MTVVHKILKQDMFRDENAPPSYVSIERYKAKNLHSSAVDEAVFKENTQLVVNQGRRSPLREFVVESSGVSCLPCVVKKDNKDQGVKQSTRGTYQRVFES
jgi:hypothetical protein